MSRPNDPPSAEEMQAMTDAEEPHTIGSSDVPKILGLSPYGGPWSVWPELVGLVPRYGGTTSPSARRGNRMEAVVAGWWAEDRDHLDLRPGPGLGTTDPVPTRDGWAHCRQDATVHAALVPREELAPAHAIAEVKTLRWFDDRWGEEGTDQVRADYLTQVVHQIHVLQLPAVVIAYATGSDTLRTYFVDPPPELVARQAEIVKAWWDRHVVGQTPPVWDPSAECARHLHRAYGTPLAKKRRQATDYEIEIAEELAEVRRQAKILEVRKRELEGRLKAEIGEAYGIEAPGRFKATWSPSTRTTIDTQRLREEEPEIATRYSRTSEGRRFLFTPAKTQPKDTP